MNIRERIRKDFGVDLPIKGGLGNSLDTAVIVEQTEFNDYVGIEYAFLKYIGLGRGIAWKTIGQSLEFHANKKIDKIQIETIHTTQQETITQIENYYFDITECFGHPPAFMDKNKNEDKLGELIQYSKINERICPQPQQWNELWNILVDKKQKGSGWEPSLPLILADWWDSSVQSKQERFTQHLKWAADHDQIEEISIYLFNLQEVDWFHLND